MTNKKVYLTLVSMIMLSKFSNFPNELSENDELREYELGGLTVISSYRRAGFITKSCVSSVV